ncbi:RABGAP1 family protein [Megaselia abdita]
MEDNISSSESSEYEIITSTSSNKNLNKSPTLNLANNLDFQQLKSVMTEALREEPTGSLKAHQKSMTLPLVSVISSPDSSSSSSFKTQTLDRSPCLKDFQTPKSEFSTPSDVNRVGQSIFYGNAGKKDDHMKNERSDSEEEDHDCTVFSGVTYLGSANIHNPKEEVDILKTMSELNSGTQSAGLKVSVSIPTNCEGYVILYDAETESTIASYEVQRILFYTHGSENTPEEACFGFTWSHGESKENSIHQCHIFRCSIPEAVKQVSSCFQKAFQRYPPNSLTGSVTSGAGGLSVVDSSMLTSITSDMSGNPLNSANYEFVVSLEIKEKVGSSFTAVPRDKSCFKIRCNVDKEVAFVVKQTPSNNLQPLFIERCFGVLLSPGKLVKQGDMQLLELDPRYTGYHKIEQGNPNLAPYHIKAGWESSTFEQLNVECAKMFVTIGVDLVIKGIAEPVRFVMETPVTIQSQNEIRIMDHFILSNRRPMTVKFYLQLKRKEDGGDNWEVNSIDPSEEIIEGQGTSSLIKMANNISKMVRSTSSVSIESDCPTDYSSDGDEPLLSGTGEVSKDCSVDTLNEWDPVLKEWDEKRPKNLANLVRMGVPEALRMQVWQKLANIESKSGIADHYAVLITKETNCEAVIQRDINRTFPANKFFKETGGSGQDALFKVSKAYAVYDTEVGYCQGLSFIAASLLLHMPEEDSFGVLVALMYDYGLRDLYKDGFDVLHMSLYQLNRLMKDHLPKLHEHFERNGVESHMFASQWFLTLYTARFPLCFVFHVLDVFLLDGMPILFQVAITLLSLCESELRSLDFEGMLKYIRVSLPKKCRSASNARKIMKKACELKMKKLKQYGDEYYVNKKNEEKFQREVKVYAEKYKDKYQADIKHLELKIQENKKKQSELEQRLLEAKLKAEQVNKTHSTIVTDYKQIIQRQENELGKLTDMLNELTKTVAKCEKCTAEIDSDASPTSIEVKKLPQGELGPLDPLQNALQRIRELELELAQTKLAQVEAECKNQDLNHQLQVNSTESQTGNRNSWQPWLSKTINTIQEKVKGQPSAMATFQSYTNTDNSQSTQSPQVPR